MINVAAHLTRNSRTLLAALPHLREVVVVAAVVAGDVAGEGVDVLRPLLVVVRAGEGVGEVVGGALLVPVHRHHRVALRVADRGPADIFGNQFVICQVHIKQYG